MKKWTMSRIASKQVGVVTYRRIVCDDEILSWIRSQDKQYWIEGKFLQSGIFWVTEDLLIMIILKWPQNENY